MNREGGPRIFKDTITVPNTDRIKNYSVILFSPSRWIISIRTAGISDRILKALDLAILIGAHRSKQLSNWSEC